MSQTERPPPSVAPEHARSVQCGKVLDRQANQAMMMILSPYRPAGFKSEFQFCDFMDLMFM